MSLRKSERSVSVWICVVSVDSADLDKLYLEGVVYLFYGTSLQSKLYLQEKKSESEEIMLLKAEEVDLEVQKAVMSGWCFITAPEKGNW